MKRAMGVINLINEADDLEVLHRERCVAAIPFGARYRLIDFMLSSMVNSGMSNVAVLAHEKYRALMDHLGSGKEWDLDRKRSGLFLLPPNLNVRREVARGDLFQFFCQRDYFHRSREDIVVVTRSHMVCNIDLSKVVEAHLAGDADITMVYKQTEEETAGQCRRIRMDESGRIVEMQDHSGRLNSDLIAVEIYVMHKSFLMELVETSLAQGYDHFVRDAVMKNIGRVRIQGYQYEGYLGVINTIPSYYQNSMRLLDPAIWKSLFYSPSLIYTKIKDEPPSRYVSGSSVKNALIANGCIIEGVVENSILFRGVHVKRGAVVRNSIILQNGVIGEGAQVTSAVLDKDVRVSHRKLLHGDPNSPYLAAKRSVI